jgi:hypothetical protein
LGLLDNIYPRTTKEHMDFAINYLKGLLPALLFSYGICQATEERPASITLVYEPDSKPLSFKDNRGEVTGLLIDFWLFSG